VRASRTDLWEPRGEVPRGHPARKADDYSNQGSLMGMERFAKRHRKKLIVLLGSQIAKQP